MADVAPGGKPHSPPPSSTWLVTFTDLVALMLTFFVMLFSMSSVKIDRFKEMTDALSQTLNPSRAVTVKIPTAQYNISTAFRRRAINLDYLHAVLGQKVTENPVLQASRLTQMEDRLVISLPGGLLFAADGAELTDRARQSLFELGGVLRQIENQLGVDAFVPPAPARGRYESTWELSLARAIAVANELTRSGYRDEIVVYGYGDSRAAMIAETAPEQAARLSRRVDIVISSSAAE